MTRLQIDIQRTATLAMRASTLDATAALALYRDDWRRLAETAEDATLHMWPAVFDAWARELASGVTASVVLVHQGPRLTGVLPVMRATVHRGPAFVPRIDYAPYDRDLSPGGARAFAVRQVSSVVSWRAAALRPTLLCAPPDREGVIHAVTGELAALHDVDQIVLPVRAEDGAAWLDGLRRAGLSPWSHQLQRQVLLLDRVRPFDEIVASQSRNFRKNVNRARAAAAEAGLTYTIHEGHDAVLPHLDAVAALAAESWKAAGSGERTAIPYAGLQQKFFERVFRDRHSGMTPVLVIGVAHGQNVTASLCMQHGHALAGLLTFRNDLHPEASPGMMGIAALIDYAASRGLRTFDLNTTQDWLRHVSDSSHMLVNVAAFRRTFRGRAYDAIARARRKFQRDAAT